MSDPTTNYGVFNSVDELLIERANENNNEPIIAYPKSGDTLTDFQYLTAKEVTSLTDVAAQKLLCQGLRQIEVHEAEVIALLGLSDLDYMITMFGLSRLGYTVFLLSPRLATEAYASLLRETGCKIVCYGPELEATVSKIRDVEGLWLLPIPGRCDVDNVATIKPPTKSVDNKISAKRKVAFILHSSGSTGSPKPIYQTHQSCLENYSRGNGLRGLLTVPLFHTHGHACLYRAMFKRATLYLLDARLPLTSTNLIAVLEAVRPAVMFAVPYTLGLLAETERGIKAMQSCDVVSSAGSQIPDELGDKLIDRGVHLISLWGSTETGALMDSMRPPEDKDWSYMSIFPSVRPFVLMKPLGAQSYELVALNGLKSKTATNSDNPPNSFHTRDTFEAHPTKPDRWKYTGRLDDRVTLTNGEKVLPSIMEGRLRQHPLIREAVVFGIGRALPGVLLFRSAPAAAMSDEEFVERLWPVVDEANSKVESFACISRVMIVPIGAEVDYPQTDKGTIIRSQVYKVFEKVIDDKYETLNMSAKGVLRLNQHDTEHLILESFKREGPIDLLSADTDFFSAGVDSLQATKMAAFLRGKLYLPSAAALTPNTIFEHATAARLARYLIGLQEGKANGEEDEIEVMKRMIEKYSTFSIFLPVERDLSTVRSVILTGATGSLGSHILVELLHQPEIHKVYCLVRSSTDEDAKQRVLSILWDRGLSLPKEHEQRIVALSSNLGREDLGLQQPMLSELRNSVSLIIHNAWAVNFNLGLSSFEDQHIKGTWNLLNFALSARSMQPARFVFLSSVSVASASKRGTVVAENLLEDLGSATMGYGRSKLVTEHMVNNAARFGVDGRVIRIGQIVGDSRQGFWNDSESTPLIIRSALTLGCLPTLEEYCSWIPVDVVARIIVDLCSDDTSTGAESEDVSASAGICRFYNVVNPKSFSWTADLLPSLREAGLSFESVSPQEWLARLAASEQDPNINPTVKLRSIYESRYGTRPCVPYEEGRRNTDNVAAPCISGSVELDTSRLKEVEKQVVFSTEAAQKESETMRHLPDVLVEGYVKKFVARWLEKWQGQGVRGL
ncbi:uncharacterized protein Z520_01733 [Fonsecaea multimorphosa CBS 102226]|uniref:Carrier domain-containing protein n=1 Tax=Fonsecaea multimorphosa CBS 102226 TaxID=1442371 RepID=A0A0D2HN54_9EURO|nr:uncharacterized protein Z520_01733 [Fonsecaea multimorphosa CBS 102226]KIY03266.1 hypothetical protein Z520_01733 [Fonsecaea multimorphosa CBS 102226]OAL30185.1 hypothetical protein AYO22_01701 [Fonsecaea multimorphosa]